MFPLHHPRATTNNNLLSTHAAANDTISTIQRIGSKLRSGDLTAVEVTKTYLNRIKSKEDCLNCYISTLEQHALEKAAIIDEEFKKGIDRGILAGIPIAIKDNLCTKGFSTTSGSNILKGYQPYFDADVVTCLDASGAVILGKANMDEFGMGNTTENSAFKPTSNPWDPNRVPGGSSGGSAAAVSAQLCAAALGSDTGGSIRQPAAFCGTVGFKPSYGRISRNGLLAYASSFDCIGTLTSSVEDSAIMMDVMCNIEHSFDAQCSFRGKTSFRDSILQKESLDQKPLKGKRFAIIKETLCGLESNVSSSILKSAELIENLGAEVHEVSCPTFCDGLPAYYILALSEASSNLSRYDSIRFGIQESKIYSDLENSIKSSRFEGFGTELRRRILMGTYTLSEGYADAYYKRAQDVRELIFFELNTHLMIYDGLLTPTTPTIAYKKNEKNQEPLKMFTGDMMTVNVNLSGLPALVIRSKDIKQDEDIYPSGIQIIGKKFGEADLLKIGNILEIFSKELLFENLFPESRIF